MNTAPSPLEQHRRKTRVMFAGDAQSGIRGGVAARAKKSLSKEDARSALAQEAQKAYRVELGLDVAITYQGGWYQVTSPSGDVIQRARKVQLERRLASFRAAA